MTAFLDGWKEQGAKHGTPGYLVLANGYLHIVKLTLDHQPHMKEQYDTACFFLWKNLTLAEEAESDSTASINNAYFGKGLSLSNPLRLATIKEMKEQTASRLIADGSIKLRAEKSAAEEFSDKDSYAHLIAWKQAKDRRLHAVTLKAAAAEEHKSGPTNN